VKRQFAVICLGPLAAMSIAVGTATAQTTVRGGLLHATTATHSAVTPATVKPTYSITATGGECGSFNGFLGNDSTEYTETYFADGQYLSNYQLGCVFPTTTSTESVTQESGCGAAAPDSTMGGEAQFEDGEDVLVCGEPDVTSSGNSDANSSSYYEWEYGESCKATVLTGGKGTTLSKLVTNDQVEWYQPYTDYDGTYVNSDTTACVGVVPNTKAIPSVVKAKKVACSEQDPYTRKTIKGFGVTTTYPDRQFMEICNIPNAKT
jgi:hypothetical protein